MAARKKTTAVAKRKADAPARKRGRPSTFTQEVADAICARIAAGESMRAICSDDDMPPLSTVCTWLADRPPFTVQYTRARELQAETMADEMLTIIDSAVNNPLALEHAQARVETRKWLAGKMRPKVYGPPPPSAGGTVNVQVNNAPPARAYADAFADDT